MPSHLSSFLLALLCATGLISTVLSVDLAANETRVDFGDWAVVLHARNDGVAWRFETEFAGEINKFAVVARKKGTGKAQWWLGAITNWDARELEIPTDFLGSGEWKVEAFEDAPDSDKNAEHYVRRVFTIKAGDKIKVRLAPGGGFAAKFISH